MQEGVNESKLKVFQDVSLLIGQTLNLDETLEAILNVLARHLAMNKAVIALRDREDGPLKIRASHGLGLGELDRWLQAAEIDASRVVRGGELLCMTEADARLHRLPRSTALKLAKPQVSIMGAPVVLQSISRGVFCTDRLFPDDVSLEEDLRFVSILAEVVAQVLSLHHLVKEREDHLLRSNRFLKSESSERYESFFSFPASSAIAEVHQLVRRVAFTRAPVLLRGEPGSGKTLVAGLIHEISDRSGFPFVKVNCGALPDNLLAFELFGCEGEAFGDFATPRPGRIEEADGGTLFLQEIACLSLPLQARLLRCIQDGECERNGGTRQRKVDIRIVSGTHTSLESGVRAGAFREDLYYKLAVFPISLPPLRERWEDVPKLLDFFRNRVRREHGRDLWFTDEALRVLVQHPWPGNLREMENLVERLAIITDMNTIDVEDLAPYIAREAPQGRPRSVSTKKTLKEIEMNNVMAALERNHWVQSRAAKELGISLRQMGYRVKKYGLEGMVEQGKSAK